VDSMICIIYSFLFHAFVLQHSGSFPVVEEVSSIGDARGHALLSIAGIAVGPSGVYVTDNLQYSIFRFGSDGSLLGRQGRRGSGPAEFRSPHGIAIWRDTVVVFERSIPKISIFDTELRYVKSFNTSSLLTDIEFDADGHLYIACFTMDERERLVVYDVHGKKIKHVTLRQKKFSSALASALRICFDNKRNRLIVASVFANVIEVYDKSRKLITAFSVPGLRERAELKNGLPTDDVLKDIAVNSKGEIFVLRGEVTPESQDSFYGVLVECFSCCFV